MAPDPKTQPRARAPWVVAIVGVLLVLATGALGWFLGDQALTQPVLTVDKSESYVEVLADDDAALVHATWSLDTNGDVSLSIDQTTGEVPPFTIAFLLHGGTRFKELSFADQADMSLLDPADPNSAQLIVLKDPKGPPSPTIYTVSGSSMGTWQDSGAGRRIAQLPNIRVSGPNRVLTEEDGAGAYWWGVSEFSALRSTALTAGEDELVYHYPEAPEAGVKVEQGWDQGSAYEEGISWVKTEGEFEQSRILRGGGELQTAYLRWEDPEDIARGQRNLLISGVLLGVAFALAVEALLWTTRKAARSTRSR